MADLGKTHKECYELLVGANPSATVGRMKEWRKGGLPGQSMGDGIRGAQAPEPGFDGTDEEANRALDDYEDDWRVVLERLRNIRRLELVWAAIPAVNAQRLAEEEQAPAAAGCKNCHRVVENTPNDRIFGGRCRNCHDYLRAHGAERPRELWESEIERRLSRLTRRGLLPQGRDEKKVPCL